MAGGSLYHDTTGEDAAITDINVTPFVDVVLVLLVVFMVTAKLIVTRGIEIEKPKSGMGAQITAPLRVSVDHQGAIYVNGDAFTTDAAATARIEAIAAAHATGDAPLKAIIAGDRRGAYGGVMHAISLVRGAGISAIALENEQP